MIGLEELRQYRYDIGIRRNRLLEERNSTCQRIAVAEQAKAQVAQLTDYVTRIAHRLSRFSYEEKRLALDALNVQVTWAVDQDIAKTGAIPLEVAPSIPLWWQE